MMKILKKAGFLVAMSALTVSASAQQDFSMEASGFRVPEYDSKGVMTSQLFGDRAEMQNGGEIKITGVKIEFYKDSKTAVTVTSPYCFYNQKTREARSDAPVAADMERMQMRGRGFLLKAAENNVRVFDDVVVTLHGLSQQAGGAVVTNSSTNITVITSKELLLDYKTRKARFERNVHVKDPKMEMFSEELEIQSGPDNQINWIGAFNGVKIINGEREAHAGKASYSIRTDEFLLEDNPEIVDGKNILKGDQIRFWRGSGRMVCEPSARLVMYSDSRMKGDFLGK